MSTALLLGASLLASHAAIGTQDASEAGTKQTPCPVLLAEHPVPTFLEKARDVRWAGQRSVFVSSSKTGVFRLDLPAGDQPPVLEINKGNSLADIWMPYHLASSKDYLVVGAPVFALGWKRRGEKDLAAQVAFAAVVDVDLFEDRVLVLGAQRDEEGQFAPDGAIAWTGPLSKDLAELRPVFFSHAGPRIRPMNYCGVMEIGNVRFLPDGSFVVVPGVEEGVMLYDAKGKLLRTWQSGELGFDAGCGITDEERSRLATNEPARWAWVNERRTVDDILPFAEGPGLLIRARGPKETTWQLKVLDRNGDGVTSCDLPITSPSGLTQLHGDIAGNRVVLLMWVRGPSRRSGGPPNDRGASPEVPPRLFTMQLQR